MRKIRGAPPFLLAPAAKDYLWGGNRLNDDFAKNIDCSPLAETWECSTHPDGVSRIVSGKYFGKFLTEVFAEHPEYLGTNLQKKGDLPILIKFIDAKKDLSVQVHPSDEYAKKNEKAGLGKSEMWYVLEADKGATIVYGFARDISKNKLKSSIENGTVEKYLQKIPVIKNDVFYIKAGTVHAIGAGVLVAEIQENSNLTYRLYDYDRVDLYGNKRPLQIKKALEVADLSCTTEPRQPMRVLKFKNGYATELLSRCEYFQVERMLLNTETCRDMASFQTDSSSFQVLLCIEGCGVLYWKGEHMLNFHKGDCIFVPADSVIFKIHGKAQFLKVNC